MPKTPDNLLIVADSERNADLLYVTRFFAPDPFIFLRQRDRKILVLSDLEIDRGKRTALADEIVALSSITERLKKKLKREPTTSESLLVFLGQRRVRSATVPQDFPLGLAAPLMAKGIKLVPAENLLFPEREFKTSEELAHLSSILKVTEAGMQRGFDVLRESAISRDKRLIWNRKPLTSEVLRGEIDSTIIRLGGFPMNTIVAGGEQACDPHERGSGPLKANELIILDIFPRDSRSGYYGDLTRTVVRGKASEAQRALWEMVLRGQEKAFADMKPGGDGKELHESIKQSFTDAGYATEQVNGRWQGFFHGTGHGLGLELHEHPRVGRAVFKEGQVFTVEPGLYYPGIGGVRHEDVVVIQKNGPRLLTSIAKPREL